MQLYSICLTYNVTLFFSLHVLLQLQIIYLNDEGV